jgi:hypothetical protein
VPDNWNVGTAVLTGVSGAVAGVASGFPTLYPPIANQSVAEAKSTAAAHFPMEAM